MTGRAADRTVWDVNIREVEHVEKLDILKGQISVVSLPLYP